MNAVVLLRLPISLNSQEEGGVVVAGSGFPPDLSDIEQAARTHARTHTCNATYLVLVQSLIPGPDQGGVVPNIIICHLNSLPFHLSSGCPARSLATFVGWADERAALLLGCRLKFRRRLSFFRQLPRAVSWKLQPPSTRVRKRSTSCTRFAHYSVRRSFNL